MILKLYEKNNDPRKIDEVVALLNNGGIIVYPTDTTYALGCHALKERAVEQICKIKQVDPAKHPLSIVCYDMSAISTYARISTPVYKTMKRNLPGAFTFILPALSKLPKIFRSKKGQEVGIRMPEQPIVHELLKALGAPLMTASLPEEHEETEYRTNPELIEEAYGNRVDLVIDGGEGKLLQSTIVDCTGEAPVITRQGDGILV